MTPDFTRHIEQTLQDIADNGLMKHERPIASPQACAPSIAASRRRRSHSTARQSCTRVR